MENDLYKEILQEVRTRIDWESRQSDWYKLRYTGIGRLRKPYPNAPDTHYALIDSMIDKLRPFYLGQLYGQERLATFSSNKPQSDEITSSAEEFFDYTLKQQSNFERTMFTAIDHMLTYGRGLVKIRWNPDTKQIEFVSIRPIYGIAPSWTEEVNDADWFVHVLHLSKLQYAANKTFNQDETFVKSITGRGDYEGASTQYDQEKLCREGINIAQNQNQILLWEVYRRESDKIMVDTISPRLPEEPVRESFGVPFVLDGKPFIPVTDIRYELTDPDYYSPRGVSEILAQDQLELCKLRNSKLQFLDFFGQPMFKNAGTIGNTSNFSPRPGLILPQGIEPVPPGGAPLDFKDEMQQQRAQAEDRIQVPDLNASEHLAGDRGAKGQITATQINAIASQAGKGNDMRSRIFRQQLANLFTQAWAILVQKTDKARLTLEDHSNIPPEAMHGQYRIRPSGSADGMSKEQRIAKAMAYYQALAGNPTVPPAKITKWLLAQDSAELVDELFEEPADAQMDQADKQGLETIMMLMGRTPRVKPDDVDAVHVQDMAQWGQAQMQQGKPIAPDMAARMLQHGQQHIAQMHAKKDKQGLMLTKQIEPLISALAQIAQTGQQPAPPMPMNGAGTPPAASSPQDTQARESISINYKDAPPSVQRQMEIKAGFLPATPGEHADQIGNQMPRPVTPPSSQVAR